VNDIVERAQKEFEKDSEYWRPIYEKVKEDLYFLSDNEDAQWNDKDLKSRKRSGRPALTIDQLTQYVNQVVNDIRKNTPSIDVIPCTDGDVDTAEIQQNLIRDILYRSDADTCFDVAAAYAVKGSVGFFRVDTDYVGDTFEQEFKILTVEDPLTCYLDRASVDVTGVDANHCFILDSISEEDFEEAYPGKEPTSFVENSFIKCGKNDVIIAEYFKKVIKKKKIGMTADGDIEEVQEGVEYVIEREAEEVKVKRCLLSGSDVLSESEFVGGFIPLIPVYGSQSWVNGEREITSLIRRSKDAQRMFNYWKSLETELLQKQPRATFIAAAGQVDNYAEAWEDPDKSPVLIYSPTDIGGNPVAPPQRLDPPMIPAGIVNASRSATDDIKATIGMYAASIGEASNEVSGVAIQRRNEEGETATYHFSDNLSKSISQLGKLLVDGIPKLYDTPRYVRTIDKEEEVKVVGINGAMSPDQERTYEFGEGGYDVKVVTGASYTTQRQEAARLLETTVTKNPELMTVVGDLVFKNMDFAGAQAIAERMKKFVDPKYLEEEGGEVYDPEKEEMNNVIEQGQALIAEQQQEIDNLLSELKDKQGELVIKAKSEENKKDADEADNEIDLMKLEADREKMVMEYNFKMEALAIKRKELAIKATDKQRDIDLEVNQEIQQPEDVEVQFNQN